MCANILLIEDDDFQRDAITRLLERRLGYAVIQASSGHDALGILAKDPCAVQLVVTDIGLPDISGLDVLDAIRRSYKDLPVIMLTANHEVDVIVRAMKRGASDYLTKPPDAKRTEISIRNVLKMSLLEKEYYRLKNLETGQFSFNHIVGYNRGLSGAIAVARKAAYSDIPILLTGETGVGKEVFARATHGESRRARKPFVAINCGAIPAELIESELFGHEKGSFTGAIAKTIGKFREADGGTLFLDEIGELSLDAQVKFLRVLQSREISPVGSSHSLCVDTRVIAATNSALESLVAEGRFRSDLFYRLNVLQIKLPALRDRIGDIPDLVRHFLDRIAARESRPPQEMAQAAIAQLMMRPWRGNVRELENAVYRASILSGKQLIECGDLSFDGHAASARTPDGRSLMPPGQVCLTDENGRLKPLEEVERAVFAFGMAYSENNMQHAADALKVSRSTLYRKLKTGDES